MGWLLDMCCPAMPCITGRVIKEKLQPLIIPAKESHISCSGHHRLSPCKSQWQWPCLQRMDQFRVSEAPHPKNRDFLKQLKEFTTQ
jgi:hypothetical protein